MNVTQPIRGQESLYKLYNTSYYSSATEALAQLNWDLLECSNNELVTVYKVINELTPSYLKNRFELTKILDTHYKPDY